MEKIQKIQGDPYHLWKEEQLELYSKSDLVVFCTQADRYL
jgi:hypothetical protein